MRKGEELKAPRHASVAAARDGNLPVFPTISNKLFYSYKLMPSSYLAK